MKLNSHECNIIKILLEHNYFLSTTEIAEETKMSWNTVRKYLREFKQKDWVLNQKAGKQKNTELWKAKVK